MSSGTTSGIVDGFGDSGLSNNIRIFEIPSLAIDSWSSKPKKNNRFKSKRRIYQLGIDVPCIENDDQCSDDSTSRK
jgi:hypothetical protein